MCMCACMMLSVRVGPPPRTLSSPSPCIASMKLSRMTAMMRLSMIRLPMLTYEVKKMLAMI